MGAAYALLGLVLGVVINEALRRGMRHAGQHRDPRRSPGQPRSVVASALRATESPARSSCCFTAQDYYDR